MTLLAVLAVVVMSAIGWSAMTRMRGRLRADLSAAAGALGLRLQEGAAALEEKALEARAEGRPEIRVPPFLQRLLAGLVGPRISGTYRGVRVSISTETHSSNSGSHTETVIKAYYAKPLPFDLHLGREGVGARIAKAFGGQDVEVGDAEFDAAVRVKTGDADAARAFLSAPARRRAVLAAVAACPGMRATRSHVSFERQGTIRKADQMAAVLDAIAPLAAALGDAGR
jgi:hypothetical protein